MRVVRNVLALLAFLPMLSGAGVVALSVGTTTAGSGGDPGGVEPFFEDDFESYSSGASVGGEGNGTFAWVGGRETQVSTLIANAGTKSLQFRYDDVPEDSHVWAEQRFSLGQDLTEIWIEFYLYYPDGTEGIGSAAMNHLEGPSADNNKFFRLWGGGNDNYTASQSKVGASTRPSGAGPNGQIGFEYWQDPDVPIGHGDSPFAAWENPDIGRWIRVRMYYRHVSAPGADDGEFALWEDDTKVIDFQAVNQDYDDTNPNWDSGYFMGSDNTHIATRNGGDQILIFVDDVKMYDEDPGWE